MWIYMIMAVMAHWSASELSILCSQLLSAMVAKLGNMDEPLPQDSFEGVDEDEWVSAMWCDESPPGVCWKRK